MNKGEYSFPPFLFALEYEDRNIRVNAVAPGFIESGLVAKPPIGRLGNPEEIARVVFS